MISWTDAPTAISRGLRWGAQDGLTYTNHNSQYAVLTSNYRLDKATLTSVTSFYSFKQTDMNHFGSAYHGNLVTQYAKFDQAAEEVRAVTDFDGPLNVTAGAIYAHGKFEFDTDAIVTATIPIDPATGRTATFGRNAGFTADTISAFAEATWNIQPTLELAGGARWTHEKRDTYQQAEFVQPASRASFAFPQRFDDHFTDSNVSPQATLTWRPDTSHTYYAAYKTGFKSGGYNTSQNLAATTKFTDGQFTSEKVKGGELGAKTEWLDGMLRANVVGFYYKYTNLQVQVYNSVTNTQIVTNVGALVTKGIEAQLALRNPGGITGLNLSADLSYDHAAFGSFPNASCYTGQSISAGCDGSRNAAGLFNTQVLTGKTPPKAPKWAGRVNGDYTTPVFGEYSLNFASSVGFSSKYNYTDALRPDAIQKGYARIDATVRLSAPQDRWQIALIGRNLTSEWVITSANDQTINTGAGPTGGPVGLVPDMNTIVDRGRQFYLEFSTRF